jgi:aldose 1-epimerase
MTQEIVTISDAATGARAKILPGRGFNCFSFLAPAKATPLEVLWSVADFAEGGGRPSGSGIPLMFPFAGRIRGVSFEYQGKSYPLQAGDGIGNAIHGFVIDRPWRVTARAADRVTGEFQASMDDPSLLKNWPADFRITAEYRLADGKLISDYTIENSDTKPLPFGFGTHPYFRLPLGGMNAADCRVRVPIGSNWNLEGLLPTGVKSNPPLVGELSRGMPSGEMKLDHVFGDVQFDNHRATATVYDPLGKNTLKMTFDDQFTACVVYNPPHREAVCIEPYTTVPDAFTLAARGIDPHLIVLPPGKVFRTRIEISLND